MNISSIPFNTLYEMISFGASLPDETELVDSVYWAISITVSRDLVQSLTHDKHSIILAELRADHK